MFRKMLLQQLQLLNFRQKKWRRFKLRQKLKLEELLQQHQLQKLKHQLNQPLLHQQNQPPLPKPWPNQLPVKASVQVTNPFKLQN